MAVKLNRQVKLGGTMTDQEKLGKIFELMNEAEYLLGLETIQNILVVEYYSDYSGCICDSLEDEIIEFESLDECIEKLTEYVNILKAPEQAEKIDELQQHDTVLKSVNEELEKRVEELKDKLLMTEIQRTSAEDAVDVLFDEVDHLIGENRKLEAENEELEKRVEELKAEIEGLKDKLFIADTQRNPARDNIEDFFDTIDHLARENKKLKQRLSAMGKIHKKSLSTKPLGH